MGYQWPRETMTLNMLVYIINYVIGLFTNLDTGIQFVCMYHRPSELI